MCISNSLLNAHVPVCFSVCTVHGQSTVIFLVNNGINFKNLPTPFGYLSFLTFYLLEIRNKQDLSCLRLECRSDCDLATFHIVNF